ncbi:glycosyl hydrolase [Cellulomonas sp. KRMCY2]|uniref:glycosyl hydrolase n=1 Tax=Cellulomonas sp. KRMCY2 TaxID=1304865 RepID=UPI00045E6692|nr:glycosyl hydrolase [Cellulomonas sp. KRMCY2]
MRTHLFDPVRSALSRLRRPSAPDRRPAAPDPAAPVGPARSLRRRRRRRAVAVLAAGALTAAGLAGSAAQAENRQVGAGSYTTDVVGPAPEGCAALATDPRAFLTDDAPLGPVPTNDWWSSLVLKKWNCATSEPLHAHPVSYLPSADGLGLGYTREPTMSGTPGGVGEFHHAYARDLLVGVDGLDAPVVEVADWSDWTVTPSWSDGTRTLEATIGHGLPFSWYRMTGGDAVLTGAADLSVWLDDGARIGFTSGGADYVAFAPAGAAWTTSGTTLRSDLAGAGYLSVAVLPTTPQDDDADRRDLADAYTPYAHNEVTGTRADYVYDQSAGVVRTTYSVQTEARGGSGGAGGTVVSLYPHQSQHLGDVEGDIGTSDRSFASPRGAMTTLVGATSFTTVTPFTGVLPEIPAVATGVGAAEARLDALLDEVAQDPMGPPGSDTYWTGKALGRAARIAEIADQVGRDDVRDTALTQIRSTLTDWLTADPGETGQLFAYNEAWGTLVGFPASYGSDKELNDHHFHYGYFITAAATLARFDPAWAQSYGGMVDLLIRDANGYDRDETRFPYLRDFDIYAGHDWASGHGAFAAGNNQESSSEGMNFAAALVLWGEATGDRDVRDAGAYLYATQAAAIQAYWFDGSGAIPDGFGHSTVGMIWGDGGAYATWFSAEPEMIQGINTLPITGGHLYLGIRPDDVRANYAELVTANHGNPTVWQDIAWSYLALGDGPAALAALDAQPGYPVEEGESRAHTYHWVANLAALGTLDTTVTADHPLAAVLTRDGGRTYVAANVTAEPLTVTYSDGTTLSVAPGQTATTGAHTWSGGSGTGGPGEPTPTPTSTPTPTPTPDPTTPPTDAASPLYLSADGLSSAPGSGVATLRPTSGPDAVGDPATGRSFEVADLDGAFTGGKTGVAIGLDAGTSVGNATRLRVSYDLTGDGTWDRVETYRYFPTDPVVGWEAYRETQGLTSADGLLADLDGGTVRVELWNVIGAGTTDVDLTGSVLLLPYR